MSTTAEILASIANLTSRLNEFVTNSKATNQFNSQEELNNDSLIRVEIDEVSEKITISQLIEKAKTEAINEIGQDTNERFRVYRGDTVLLTTNPISGDMVTGWINETLFSIASLYVSGDPLLKESYDPKNRNMINTAQDEE